MSKGDAQFLGAALTTEDISATFERAVEHGAEVVDAPLFRADYGVASTLLRDL